MSMDELIYLQKQRDEAKSPSQLLKAQKAMDDYWFPKRQKAQRKKPKIRIYDQDEEWAY